VKLELLELEAFRGLLAKRLGLFFGEDKREFLGDVLNQGMLDGKHLQPAEYVRSLEGEAEGPAWERLIESLTVGETSFFRQWDHYRALVDTVLPMRIKARSAERRLRILSAGCASGEEAYSLAMLLAAQFPELDAWEIVLKGVDIEMARLAKAAKGLYSPWSLRDTAPAMRERFFHAEGRDFQVKDAIRAKVAFERRNLSGTNSDLWPANHYDFIFCRNMLMYFTPEAQPVLVARMAQALAPGGFLFLGYAETLRGLSQDFHLCHTHDTFYYQRQTAGRPAAQLAGASAVAEAPPLWQAPDPSVTWMESIQKASERIASLAARTGQARPGGAAAAESSAPALERALELTRNERFTEALEALPEGPAGGVDAWLLRAVLLVNLGRAAEAEAACARLLQADDLNAGAHYVMALCREHAGDLATAAEEDHSAVYLDAAFAMPWLHLGLLARRGGQNQEARRNLEQALALLAREDSSRVLLFGGGFGREGLMQLCRSSLRSLEAVR
jgi:chemotaxis protein methyltransferase CheR